MLASDIVYVWLPGTTDYEYEVPTYYPSPSFTYGRVIRPLSSSLGNCTPCDARPRALDARKDFHRMYEAPRFRHLLIRLTSRPSPQWQVGAQSAAAVQRPFRVQPYGT